MKKTFLLRRYGNVYIDAETGHKRFCVDCMKEFFRVPFNNVPDTIILELSKFSIVNWDSRRQYMVQIGDGFLEDATIYRKAEGKPIAEKYLYLHLHNVILKEFYGTALLSIKGIRARGPMEQKLAGMFIRTQRKVQTTQLRALEHKRDIRRKYVEILSKLKFLGKA